MIRVLPRFTIVILLLFFVNYAYAEETENVLNLEEESIQNEVVDLSAIYEKIDVLEKELADYKVENAEKLSQVSNDALDFVENAESYSEKTISFFLRVLAVIGTISSIAIFFGWRDLRSLVKNQASSQLKDLVKDEVETLKDTINENKNEIVKLRAEQAAKQKEQKKEEDIQQEWNKAFATNDDPRTQAVHLRNIIKLDPSDYQALISLGVAMSRIGDEDGAIENYEKAIKINPNGYSAFSNWAASLIEKGEYQKAIDYANVSIRINTGFAAAYYNRACANILLGKKEAGLSDLKKSIELDSIYKKKAPDDKDFKSVKNDPDFQTIIGANNQSLGI